MQNGRQPIEAHPAAFARAEKDYRVPPALIAAFGALESDFASADSWPTAELLARMRGTPRAQAAPAAATAAR